MMWLAGWVLGACVFVCRASQPSHYQPLQEPHAAVNRIKDLCHDIGIFSKEDSVAVVEFLQVVVEGQQHEIGLLSQQVNEGQAKLVEALEEIRTMSTREATLLKEKQEAELRTQQLALELANLKGVIGSAVKPRDCRTWQKLGYNTSAAYRIYPVQGECGGVRAWCDMDTDGGGWTVFLARQAGLDPQQEFDLSWQAYEEGFGSAAGEYWLGNRHLHALASDEHQVMRVDVEDVGGEARWAAWDEISVAGEEDKYAMWSSQYHLNSTLGDVLPYPNAIRFSTHDSDNDKDRRSCSNYSGRGGWWFNKCYIINPTAPYDPAAPSPSASPSPTLNFNKVQTALWNLGDKTFRQLSRVQFKIRPRV